MQVNIFVIHLCMHVRFKYIFCDNCFSGTLNGPQVSKLMKNVRFAATLKTVEKRAFDAINGVIDNFLGNRKAGNYREIIGELIQSFREMKVNMSLKIHFLHNHLDFSPDNLGDFSDEHGERFHQDVAIIEKRFKGKDPRRMLGEYCWSICRETDPDEMKRQSKRPFFLTK